MLSLCKLTAGSTVSLVSRQDARQYAIVHFRDGITIVLSSWLVYSGEEITHCLYPIGKTGHKIVKMLLAKASLEEVNCEMIDIIGVLEYTANYELALERIEYHEKLSEVDSDVAINIEKLKKTRHSRCAKKEEDFNSPPKKKRKEDHANNKSDASTSNSMISLDQSETANAVKDFDSPPEKKHIVHNKLWPQQQGHLNDELETTSNTKLLLEPLNCVNGNKDFHTSEKEQTLIDKKALPKVTNVIEIPRLVIASSNHSSDAENNKLILSGNSNGDEKPTTSNAAQTQNEGVIDSKFLLKTLTSMNRKLTYIAKEKEATEGKPMFGSGDRGDLSDFPKKTVQAMNSLEEQLKSKKYEEKLIDELVGLGKMTNVNTTVSNMMRNLISLKLGQKYTFKGRSQKNGL
ncbi:uncharacterized protein LOC122503320 [Leptopilina heterotoma]|uniref:uncharacterized protein LOC122503320 n=1 Tax=Leptopilina heterotoma TaxID=63436 RepID=UPI001CAA055A|nr:uncharacterized protein LOC122503320 [Leptopilina heterotoma]